MEGGLWRGAVTDFRKDGRVWTVPRTWTEDTATGRVELRSSWRSIKILCGCYYHIQKTKTFSCDSFLFVDGRLSFDIQVCFTARGSGLCVLRGFDFIEDLLLV